MEVLKTIMREDRGSTMDNIIDIESFIKKHCVVTRDDLKKKFNLNDNEINVALSKIDDKISVMNNKLVWSYCSERLKNVLINNLKRNVSKNGCKTYRY